MASDVDLVVLSDTPGSLEDARWFEQLRPGARHPLRGMGASTRTQISVGIRIDRGIGHRSLELG